MDTTFLTERGRRNLAILDTIRRAGTISRAEISRSLGLNVVTISNYIDEFLRQHMVVERKLDISGGGRRPVLLGLNPDSGLAIGVGLNLLNAVATTVDVKGETINKIKTDKQSNTARDVVDIILNLIQQSIDKIEQKDKIKGIGIGIAGIIDKEKDIVRWPQKIDDGYHYATISLPLKNIVEKKFGLPCLIENDATLACFGEQWLSLDSDIKNVLFLFSGVGCGIMINGEIYHGASGCAGEVSIANPRGSDEFSCETGSPCFMKRWEADLDITRRAKAELKKGRNSQILQKSGDIDNLSLKDIFNAARKNDDLAVELLQEAGRRLGIKAAYLVNIFNPQVLIVGGGIEDASGILVDAIRQAVSDWAFEEMVRAVKIIPSGLGENAVALGAANLVVRRIFTEA